MTNGAAFEVVVTPVIALPGVVLRFVPEVKNVPVVEVTPVTTVCGGATVPLTTGTAPSSVTVPPGGLGGFKKTEPPLGEVLPPLEKVNAVPLGFAAGSNAGTRRLLVAPGWRPMTEVVGAVTPVTAVPVA